MIHVRAMKVPRGNKHGPLHGFYSSSGFGPPNTKEQLRRGVQLATVASVLVLVGSLLTWLVYTEVFGSKVPIMGPLVMAVGILLVMLAIRQFCIVWKLKKNASDTTKKESAQAEDEEMPYGSMLEMENLERTEGQKAQYLQQNSQQRDSYPSYLQSPQFSGTFNYGITIPPFTRLTTTSSAALPQVEVADQLVRAPGYGPQPSAGSQMQTVALYQPLPTTISTLQSPTVRPLPPPYSSLSPTSPQAPPSTTTLVSPADASSTVDSRIHSCCDLRSQAEGHNPRPEIHYSQSQLELLDRQAAAVSVGSTSPTFLASTPSQKSLGEHSVSPQEGGTSRKSLSLSIEKTDILETI